MDIPLALTDFELVAFRAGILKRLVRDGVPPGHHDRDGLVYVFEDQRFAVSKWRGHKPEVVEEVAEPGNHEPLTVAQLQEAGMTPASFAAWYQGVLERQAAMLPPTVDFLPPDVWLATIERVEEEVGAGES